MVYGLPNILKKKKKDGSLLLIQDLTIQNYINRFLKIHGLILCNCYLHRTQQNISIYLSYFTTILSSKLFKIKKRRIKSRSKFVRTRIKKTYKFLKKFIYHPKLFFNSNIKKRSKIILKKKIVFLFKVFKKNILIKKKKFFYKLVACLNLFLKKKYNIKILIKNVNKGITFRLRNKESFLFRKLLVKLRFYTQFDFFIESINILLYSVKKKKLPNY